MKFWNREWIKKLTVKSEKFVTYVAAFNLLLLYFK